MEVWSLIKIFLLILIVLIYLYYILRVKNQLLHRILGTTILAVAMLMIALPGITNTIAHVMGVGRGVDLVFYILFCFLIFLIVVFYQRILKLEQQVTHLARKLALGTAREGSDSDIQ